MLYGKLITEPEHMFAFLECGGIISINRTYVLVRNGDDPVRYLVHVWLDGLYAALEAEANHDGRWKEHGAVVMQGDAVYDMTDQARRSGVRLGMKKSMVERLSPFSVFLTHDEARVAQLLRPVWQVFWEHTPWIETQGREGFFGLTGPVSRKELRACIARLTEVFSLSGWRVIGGVGSNKLIAKMATRAMYQRRTRTMPALKVDDHALLIVEDELKWMHAAQVQDIWRLPLLTRNRLDELGVHMATDLFTISDGDLYRQFGKESAFWKAFARGEDHAPILTNFPPITKEVTWRAKQDSAYAGLPFERILKLAEKMSKSLAERLERECAGAKRLSIKVEGVGTGLSNREEDIDVAFPKPAFTSAQIFDRIKRQLEELAFEQVSRLTIALGEMRPLDLQQLSWDITEDFLCEPSWPKEPVADKICEEIQYRFSARHIRKGCNCLPREKRLQAFDPFRGPLPLERLM